MDMGSKCPMKEHVSKQQHDDVSGRDQQTSCNELVTRRLSLSTRRSLRKPSSRCKLPVTSSHCKLPVLLMLLLSSTLSNTPIFIAVTDLLVLFQLHSFDFTILLVDMTWLLLDIFHMLTFSFCALLYGCGLHTIRVGMPLLSWMALNGLYNAAWCADINCSLTVIINC